MNLESNPRSRIALYVLGGGTFLLSAFIWQTASQTEFNITPTTHLNSQMTKAIQACKTGTWVVNGTSFNMKAGEGTDASSTQTLTYQRRAARGYIDSDNFPDMTCVFSLDGGGGGTYTYLGLMRGESNNRYHEVGAELLGESSKVTSLAVVGNQIRVAYIEKNPDATEGAPANILTSRRLFLEGDELSTSYSTSSPVIK